MLSTNFSQFCLRLQRIRFNSMFFFTSLHFSLFCLWWRKQRISWTVRIRMCQCLQHIAKYDWQHSYHIVYSLIQIHSRIRMRCMCECAVHFTSQRAHIYTSSVCGSVRFCIWIELCTIWYKCAPKYYIARWWNGYVPLQYKANRTKILTSSVCRFFRSFSI